MKTTEELLKLRLAYIRKRLVEANEPVERDHFISAYIEILELLGVLMNKQYPVSVRVYTEGYLGQ